MSTQVSQNIVVIGGGTGTATFLSELKHYTKKLSAIVNMCDDGGSSGRLREELGVMPPGDIRKCLTALSNNATLSNFYSSRIKSGLNSGHPPGNLILAKLEQKFGSFEQAVNIVSHRLSITGQVLPVTLESHALMLDDGENIVGESNIEHRHFKTAQPIIRLNPLPCLNPKANIAIREADIIVIAPGNLFGSILPSLMVKGIKEAIEKSSATVVMIANLLNKPGQTADWHVVDYVNKIQQYIGDNRIDYVIYNDDLPSSSLLNNHAASGEHPVAIQPEPLKQIHAQAISGHLLAPNIATEDSHDTLTKQPRNSIRHNAKVAVSILINLPLKKN